MVDSLGYGSSANVPTGSPAGRTTCLDCLLVEEERTFFNCSLSCAGTNLLGSRKLSSIVASHRVLIAVQFVVYMYGGLIAVVNWKKLKASLPWRAVLYTNTTSLVLLLLSLASAFTPHTSCLCGYDGNVLLQDMPINDAPVLCAASAIVGDIAYLMYPFLIMWQSFAWYMYAKMIATIKSTHNEWIHWMQACEMVVFLFAIVATFTFIVYCTVRQSHRYVRQQAYGLPCTMTNGERVLIPSLVPVLMGVISVAFLLLSMHHLADTAVSKLTIGHVAVVGLQWVPPGRAKQPRGHGRNANFAMMTWQFGVWCSLVLVLLSCIMQLVHTYSSQCIRNAINCPLVKNLMEELAQFTCCTDSSQCSPQFSSADAIHSQLAIGSITESICSLLASGLLYWAFSGDVVRPLRHFLFNSCPGLTTLSRQGSTLAVLQDARLTDAAGCETFVTNPCPGPAILNQPSSEPSGVPANSSPFGGSLARRSQNPEIAIPLRNLAVVQRPRALEAPVEAEVALQAASQSLGSYCEVPPPRCPDSGSISDAPCVSVVTVVIDHADNSNEKSTAA
ncbi:uncharacterized protein LOC135809971 [Sycon ciliatum]|uniref:uncharacterized protein LOC135809971 n=1 Tax=Sycon ciliatum TaxID=27933 RepID=UPI0020ACF5AD|eukprot:scpid54993/ scgid21988/ 